MERFLKEYANYRKQDITGNELMQQSIKDYAVSRINKALAYRERGFITINEAVKLILNAEEGCMDVIDL